MSAAQARSVDRAIEHARHLMTGMYRRAPTPEDRARDLTRLMGDTVHTHLKALALTEARHLITSAQRETDAGWAGFAWDQAELAIRACVELGVTDAEITSLNEAEGVGAA